MQSISVNTIEFISNMQCISVNTIEFISNMQCISVDTIEFISNIQGNAVDTIEFISNVQGISNINVCLVMRLIMQVEYVFINICFATVMNLGSLELTLLHDPMMNALTCSLHRAKVGRSYSKWVQMIYIFQLEIT